MILVTVGMHPMGFERLVRKMDEIAAELEDEVIMQIGGTKYAPRNAKHFNFTTEQEMRELCQKARIVVTHGGVGSILEAIKSEAIVIAVPRLKKLGEVIDDHQSCLVRELEKEGKLAAVYDIDMLEEALQRENVEPSKLANDRRLINALKDYVARFARKLTA